MRINFRSERIADLHKFHFDACFALQAAVPCLSRPGSDEFRATLAETSKASKIFPGIVVLEHLLDRSGHDYVLPAEVELPVRLNVEHFGETTRLSCDARVAPGL